MNRLLKSMLLISTYMFCMMSVNSCKKDDEIEEIDQQLLDMAKSTSGFVWYKNSGTLLNKSAGSGHPQPLLRTRYNAIAAADLDSMGVITAGTAFQDGALIVKELYESSSSLGRYAILYKKSSSAYADAKGWVWGYINADGTVEFSATKKGSSCISCHSQADNIDYMLMNKYFP